MTSNFDQQFIDTREASRITTTIERIDGPNSRVPGPSGGAD